MQGSGEEEGWGVEEKRGVGVRVMMGVVEGWEWGWGEGGGGERGGGGRAQR